MRTLLVNHLDSYTFNLANILTEINHEPPVIISLDDPLPTDFHFDNIVLSPGPGTPYREEDVGVTSEVLELAIARNIPVFGVCLGHQILCAKYGHKVSKRTPAHGRISTVELTADGQRDPLLRGVPRTFNVVRYHSLGADAAGNEDVLSLGTTGDLLQIFRIRDRLMWGVQFHPESILTAHGVQILRNFCECAISNGPCKSVSPPFKPLAMDEDSPTKPTETPMIKWRHLPGNFDVESIFALLGKNAFWLDGSRSVSKSAILGGGALQGKEAYELSYYLKTRQLCDSRASVPRTVENFFDFFETEVAACARTRNDPSLPVAFQCCGFVGYFAYEMKAQSYAKGDNLFSEQGGCSAGTPDAYWRFVDRQLVVTASGDVWLVGVDDDWMNEWTEKIRNCVPWPENGDLLNTDFHASKTRDEYIRDIEACIDYIGDGESYELCLTTQFHCSDIVDARSAYRRLRRQNPAPHGAYIGSDDFQVLSSSPEKFLKIHNGWAEVRPIKGTVARGSTPEEDEANRRELATDEKYHAENLMIVDLMRNDLSTFCVAGSVHCPHLMNVEPYPTVFQLVSTVMGRLLPEVSVVTAVRSCFPAGSMTGAPKLRSLQILERLEKQPRGIYSGCMGWITSAGCDLSVVIRTVIITPQSMHLGAGGAIIAMSDPQAEWDEMLLKTKAPFRALCNPLVSLNHDRRDFRPPFNLFETVRVETSGAKGKVLFAAEHYKRLHSSCAFFGIPCPEMDQFVEDVLLAAENKTSRVHYNTDGTRKAVPLADIPVWTFEDVMPPLIRAAVDSLPSNTDILTCCHKTTDRRVYDEALARRKEVEDVILHNIRGEVTEFTIGNLCLETEFGWVTPPARCGVLPGVLRGHLLASGLLQERVITVYDLKNAVALAQRVVRINSVRGIQLVSVESS